MIRATPRPSDKGKHMKRLILLAITLAALSACNTIAGVGEDVSDGARKVQNTF